ncbi:MAG: twitch domain-containing radical SAM protein, partial [Bdellovibrionaceae bacterium]|nr:twitch domain-containing radical SAM protein [Pseudobdellovibrionaceae bacterium]
MSADIFCPLPWVLQATRNDGVFRVCAHAQNSPCRGEAKDESGTLMIADQSNWEQARNAQTLKAIRADFLKNKWPLACVRCRTENQSGISSRQAEEVKRYKGVFEKSQAIDVTSTDGFVKNFGPLELDLRFGNRCNLKCTMCSPKSSDLWYQDHYHVWGTSFKNWKEETVTLKPGASRIEASGTFDEWYMTPHFLEQVRLQLPHVRKVHFSGGEPLLVSRFYEVLEAIVEVGVPQETVIEFITNATLLPDKLVALFPLFKKVNVGVSIDALAEKNEYIRYPS